MKIRGFAKECLWSLKIFLKASTLTLVASSSKNGSSSSRETILASVVLPTPAGPKKMQ